MGGPGAGVGGPGAGIGGPGMGAAVSTFAAYGTMVFVY